MCLFTRLPLWIKLFSTTRGTEFHSGDPLVRNHSLNFGRVCVADQRRAAKPALTLLVFGSQNVTQKCMRSLHLPTGGLLEALSGAFVCLQFWHKNFQFSIQHSAVSPESRRGGLPRPPTPNEGFRGYTLKA